MKRYFLLFGSFFFLPILCQAQESRPGGWSVAISSGGQYSLSSSMHGDIAQYESALAKGTTATQYPFNTYMAYSVGFGAEADYRFSRSPLGLYAGGYGTRFSGGQGGGGRFTMTIISTVAGIEYTSGQIYQRWNFYGKLGLVPSVINSSNRTRNQNRNMFFNDSLALNTVDSRLGMEIEIGERYHFPRLPIGIEASINYTDVNLFGKSYTAPVFQTGLFRRANGSINDAKNPNDPNDSPRTIDYLSIRVGARFYF